MATRLGAIVLGIVVCLPSCSRGPSKYPVSGSVSWNGEPIASGDIIFYPDDTSQLPEAGKIVNGRYEMKVTAGAKKVHLYASKERPGQNPAMGPIERFAVFPPEYNAITKLTVEISRGTNHHDFVLPQ